MSDGPPGLELRVRDSRRRCPYCHGELEGREELRTCPSCQATSHTDCWAEHRGCPACSALVAKQQPRERIRVRAPYRSPLERRRVERFAQLRREHRINARFVQILIGTLVPSLVLVGLLGGAQALFGFGQVLLYPAMAVALAYYFIKEKQLRKQARAEVDAEQRRETPPPGD